MGFSHQYGFVRMGVNMSSGEIFVILLIISSSTGQRGYKGKRDNFRRANPPCDVTVRDLKTEITSPGYPNSYPPLSNCRYTILPANEAVCQVSIHFVDFDVEESPNCFKDRLQVGEDAFCGRIRNYSVNHNLTRELKIRFLSDSDRTGRGFRLRLEQIHCGNTLRYEGQPKEACCSREYSEPHFVLTSPGFLATDWTDSNCLYTIHPSSENVCRLRFSFKNFWVGEEDVFYGCVNGFVEIDRRRFCGCMNGYEYVSNFDESRRKEVWYSYGGPGNRGFVIEVAQEECQPFGNRTDFDPNTEIEVFMTNTTSEKAVSRFLIPRDGSRCRDWGSPEWTRSVLADLRTASCRSATASQFYPFPGDPIPFPGEPAPFPEEPAPFPIPAEPAFPSPPVLPPVFYPPNKCLGFGDYRGVIGSPNFPDGYPLNLRLCYAFYAKPGHCRLQLYFLEFSLEKSFKCWKDYLLIGRHRFCGDYWHRKRGIFDFDSGIFLMTLVTDWYFTERGFHLRYMQIPCHGFTPIRLESLGNSANNSEIIAGNVLN